MSMLLRLGERVLVIDERLAFGVGTTLRVSEGTLLWHRLIAQGSVGLSLTSAAATGMTFLRFGTKMLIASIDGVADIVLLEPN